MTIRAHALGMSRTTFRNASGLPDWGQVTTARDLALLARHLLQDFPQFYHYFSTPSFVFHGRTVPNHQTMLRTYPGADGLKTGYTEASGYNVVTSAERGDVRVIGVVLGASNGWERDLHMAALLDQGFLRLGVAPVEVARHEPFYRLPLIGAARAAPVPAMAETSLPPAMESRPAANNQPGSCGFVPDRAVSAAGAAACRARADALDHAPRAGSRLAPARGRSSRVAPECERSHPGLSRAPLLHAGVPLRILGVHTRRPRPDGRGQRRKADHDPYARRFRRHARGRPPSPPRRSIS